ncbi:MAG: hypothetical protein KKH22_00710 [Proteobacteria bacterium]|nr:hypothetical protein [Pseudomonadota bacterium]
MGRYFFISGCAVAALHFAGVTSAGMLDPMIALLGANRTALLAGGLLGALALVCASALFGGIGFFNILYVMAKGVFELVQLLLCAMTVAALVFWFDLGINFWQEGGGPLTIVLYAWFYGAAISLRVFDFNYPIRDTLISFSALPFVCMMMFWGSTLIR